MTWTLEFDTQAQKEMRKLPERERGRIIRFFDERVLVLDDPRRLGGPLKGPLKGVWRYRVGNLRILCRIEDDKLVVLVISVGNRREVYR